jgi:hypothetical protein
MHERFTLSAVVIDGEVVIRASIASIISCGVYSSGSRPLGRGPDACAPH